MRIELKVGKYDSSFVKLGETTWSTVFEDIEMDDDERSEFTREISEFICERIAQKLRGEG